MAQTRLKSGNLHMVGGDNGTSGNVLKSKGDGTMEWGAAITPPIFSSVDYPGDDTALDPAGGQSLIINGANFVSGITCSIDGTTPSSITLNSASQITVTTPAKSAGTYTLVITNADGGTATAANAVSYNGIPAFTNAAGSLGSVDEGSAVNLSVAATEPDGGAITHTIISGSLPSGLSLNATTGAITGTAPSVSADTTSNFTIRATDNENQSADRAYSITVTNLAPSDNFNAVTYTGNGSSQTITVGFQPDLVWIKSRTDGFDNNLLDSSRGDWILTTNKTVIQEAGNSGVVITSNGFTVDESAAGTTDQEVNKTNSNYIAWCFKANGGTTSTGSGTGGITNITTQVNDTLGFSIIKFTEGTGTSSTVNHGLSAAPDLVISKRITGNNQGWFVHHKDLSGSQYLFLDTTAAAASSSSVWNGTAPDSTKITLGPWQTETDDYGAQGRIIYAFTSVTGFSKIDSYTVPSGGGDTFVETGFKPKFLMIKCTSHASTHWEIMDSARSPGLLSNGSMVRTRANENSVDGTFNDTPVRFLSNGFMLKKSVTANTYGDYHASGRTYAYIAFAADPDATTPTLADSFGTKLYTGNGSSQSITGFGFKPDFIWIKKRNGTGNHYLQDTLRGLKSQVSSNVTAAETTYSSNITSYDTDGFTLGTATDTNNNGSTYVSWAWKAAGEVPSLNTDGSSTSIVNVNQNSGFSIIRYNMNLTSGTFTIGHGLSSAPELVFFFSLDQSGSTSNIVYPNDNSKILVLDNNGAASSGSSYWNSASPTSTVINMGTDWTSNHAYYAGETIAYAFTSVTGFSKIGSYTGNGSTQSITGLGFQPNWVLIKETTAAESWRVFDSVRGATKRLFPDLNNAESVASDSLTSFDSDGFSLGSSAGINENSQTYTYMAFKIN